MNEDVVRMPELRCTAHSAPPASDPDLRRRTRFLVGVGPESGPCAVVEVVIMVRWPDGMPEDEGSPAFDAFDLADRIVETAVGCNAAAQIRERSEAACVAAMEGGADVPKQ